MPAFDPRQALVQLRVKHAAAFEKTALTPGRILNAATRSLPQRAVFNAPSGALKGFTKNMPFPSQGIAGMADDAEKAVKHLQAMPSGSPIPAGVRQYTGLPEMLQGYDMMPQAQQLSVKRQLINSLKGTPNDMPVVNNLLRPVR